MSLSIRMSSKLNSRITIKFMLVFICLERAIEMVGIPHSIIFLLDLLNIYLLLNIVVSHGAGKIIKNRMVQIHLIVFLITISVALFNGVGVLLIIWALRNLLRFYIFFGACLIYLKQNDVQSIYGLLEKLFYLNIVLVVLQYIRGYRGDFLGGIFGITTGANAYSNVFLLLVCTYNIAKLFEKKEKPVKVILLILLSFILCILTEIKVFFFEIVLIVVLNVVIIGIVERKYKVLIKGFVIAVLVVVCVFFSAGFIAKMYPSVSNSEFLSIEGLKYILTRETGYTGLGDLNRLTAIGSLNKLPYFKEAFSHRFFGMGLGAAEYSNSSILLQSSFYTQYGHLHYYWFLHAWMYIECGYLGLFGYLAGFFANIPFGIKTIRQRKKLMLDTSSVVGGIVLVIMTVMLYIYNQSLRLESAYLLYFAFAAIFIGGKEVYEKKLSIS